LAINSLVEQGSTTLAELNDNYRFARKHVGTLLLSLVKEDIGTAPYKVSIESNGQRHEVMLNQPMVDEDGFTYLTNDVASTAMLVELEDVPDTPSFRIQQMTMLTEIVKSLPPEIQPLLADFMLRSTDLPFRHEAADRVAKALGLDQQQDPNAPDPAAAQEAAMAQFQQQQMQLQLEEQAAKVQKAQMEAQATQVKIQNAQMDAATKMQMAQQKMVMSEDDHATSLDEQSLRMVQEAQASEEDRQMKRIAAQEQQKQQVETHRMNTIAAKEKQRQASEAHKAKLRAMNKPKPSQPKR
jgi:hypothetical protein